MFRKTKFTRIAALFVVLGSFFCVDSRPAFSFFQAQKPAGSEYEATIRIKPLGPVVPGREAVFAFELVAAGQVVATSFTLNFDPAAFKYVSSSLGTDRPETVNLAVNDQQTAKGKFGLLIDSRFPYSKGTKQIATIVFAVAPDAKPGDYSFFFNDTPAKQGVAAVDGKMLKTDYQAATIKIGERKKAIVGRVLRADGRGSWHATVSLRLADGSERTYRTGSFGAFIFEGLPDGDYTIIAKSRRHPLESQKITAQNAFTEVNFVEPS